jgi:predicted metallopeptidase
MAKSKFNTLPATYRINAVGTQTLEKVTRTARTVSDVLRALGINVNGRNVTLLRSRLVRQGLAVASV